MCSTNHPGPFQPRRATHAHSAQDADPRRAEALRWLLRRLCHWLVRLPRQEQRHGRARYLGQEGVSSSPTPSLDSYKLCSLISHIVPRIATLPQLYLYACMWPSANPVRTAATSPYTGAAGPLRGLGHQHSPHALPALRPGWRGGHAKSACRRVGAIHSAPTHTAAPSGAKRVRRCSGQRSTPTGRGEAPGRACSQLFFRGCVAAPRAARPRQGRHMQSPLLHTLLILCSSTTPRLGRRQHPARDLHLPPLPPCRHGRALHRAAEGGVVRGGVPSLRPHRVQLALGGGGHPVGPRPAGMCTARKIRKLTLLRGSWVWVGSRELVCLWGGGWGQC